MNSTTTAPDPTTAFVLPHPVEPPNPGSARGAAAGPRARTAPPLVTWSVIGLLVAVFLAEQAFGLEPSSGLLRPSLRTLVALGGLNGKLVLGGDWWRMLTAPLLHGDLTHLTANCLALALCGGTVERLIGREWLSATLFVGAIGGALGSLLVNDAAVCSVGASGAITAVLACGCAATWHLTTKEERSRVQAELLRFLLPALIPLAQPTGIKVDIAAHLGGAAAGAAVGLLILSVWSRQDAVPRYRRVAVWIAATGAATVAVAFVPVVLRHHTFALAMLMIPAERMPQTEAAIRAEIPELVSRYPRDPRGRLAWALLLRERKDLVGAERELEAALADAEIVALFDPKLAAALRDTLAAVKQEKDAAANQPATAAAPAPPRSEAAPAPPARSTAPAWPTLSMEGSGLDDPEEAVWSRAQATSDAALLREFLRNFPKGPHADAARQRLASLEQHGRPPSDGVAGASQLNVPARAAGAPPPIQTVTARPIPPPPVAPTFQLAPPPAPAGASRPIRMVTARAVPLPTAATTPSAASAPGPRAAARLATGPGGRSAPDASSEEAAWARAGTTFDPTVLRSFLKLYPSGRHAAEAQERLNLLVRKATVDGILKVIGGVERR